MIPVQRYSETLSLLARQQVVSVEDLAAHLDVSLSTVRRDLDELERQGTLRRVHGGAVRHGAPDSPEPPPALREIERHEEKQAIAARAADLIQPGSTLLIAGGTTTAALADLIGGIPDLTVVTNSLDVANRLVATDVELILLGGALRRPELSLLGSLVSSGLDEIHVDHAMMGVYGIDLRSGLLGASALECDTDRKLSHCAARLTVLADASKFTRRSPHRIAALSAIAELVTSRDAPAEDVAALRELGMGVHLV